jgi:hypothetical protein
LRIRILLLPVVPLPEEFHSVTIFSGEAICHGQRDQVLMAAQFPRDLCIPNLIEVQVRDTEPGAERSALAMNGIAVPIDLRTILHVLVPEQVELMAANPVSTYCELSRQVGQVFPQVVQDAGHLVAAEEEIAVLLVRRDNEILAETPSQPGKQKIPALGCFLVQAPAEFGRIHLGELAVELKRAAISRHKPNLGRALASFAPTLAATSPRFGRCCPRPSAADSVA